MIGLTDFDLPQGWQWQRLKFLLSRNDGGAWGSDPDDDGGVIVLRSTEQSVDGRWIIDEPARRKLSHREFVSTKLETGDLVLTKSSGSELHIGKTTLVTEDVAELNASFSNFMQRLRPRPELHPRFAWYFLNCALARTQFDVLSNSTSGLANLNATVIGEIQIPQVALSVQQKVVNYLDRETAEIDDLIEKQERLIALLEEKRQAFISQAVTKGLDPTAPMKESGIPLLGEIPAHWSRCKVKHLFSLRNGHSLDSDEIVPEGDFPVYGGNGHRGFTSSYCFEGDHILIGRQGALCGNVHFAFGEFWATEHAIVARPVRAMAIKFFGTVLDMMNLGQYSLSAAQPGIAGEFIGNLMVPLPPVDEQMVIAERIETHERDHFAVIRRSRESLRVLTERRVALISAAVTGKIDVTGRV